MDPQLRSTVYPTVKCQVALHCWSQCYPSYPSCLRLLVLQRHGCLTWKLTFQCLILHLIFSSLVFLRLLGMVRTGEKAQTSHLISSCLSADRVKKMAGSFSSCCHHTLWKEKLFCHSIQTAAGKKRCWDHPSNFFSSADLKEVRHKGPKGYSDYGTSQSSQSIPLPQLLPAIRTLF